MSPSPHILNASKLIKTPIVTACLVNESDLRLAAVVKARIETTLLQDVVSSVAGVMAPGDCYVQVCFMYK